MTANRRIDDGFFAPPQIERVSPVQGHPDGFILRSSTALDPYPAKMDSYLTDWSAQTPDRVFLAEKAGPSTDNGWRELTYRAADSAATSVAERLLALEVGSERPILILSGNSIASAILILAAQRIGVPVVPVSPAYSLMSAGFEKLRHIADLSTPGLIYVDARAGFESAIAAINPDEEMSLWTRDEIEAAAANTATSPAVESAAKSVGPDTIAKILFTSGSTGLPKGVINTQRMMVSNQQSLAQIWPFLERRPPVLVDWLPWSHTFGANHNFNLVLRHGGTMYIDAGKPDPARIQPTLDALAEISPTLFFNVPRGYEALLPHLEADERLARNFFRELDLIFYAGAALPPPLWDRMERLALATTGAVPPMISSWGATETAPMATCAHFPNSAAGNIGVPGPGTELLFTPNMGKLEMRVRGPGVTPGYWRAPGLTETAFDDQGFYCIGDAGRLADRDDPSAGIFFDGRTGENFKLTTGTWVHVGQLRIDLIEALAPLASDVVVTGADRGSVGCMIFPNIGACRQFLEDQTLAYDALGDVARLTAAISARIATFNETNSGSSRRIDRVILLKAPPAIDKNEITDKGYINQRAVLDHRAVMVDALYRSDANVIFPMQKK